jgi:hypothetical protein
LVSGLVCGWSPIIVGTWLARIMQKSTR